jgi:hypothetical protein
MAMKTTTATVAAAIGFGLLIGTVTGGRALLDVCTWDNTSGGNWSEPTNWSPAEVPDDSTEAASIPDDGNGYTVELDMDAAIAWLSIDNPSATLNLNQQVLTLYDAGASVNHGVITANANGGLIEGDLANASDGEIRVVTGGALYFGDDDDPVDGVVLDNDGSIVVNTDGTSGDTWLMFDADATVTGNGEIFLNGDFDRAQLITGNGVSVTHGEDHLIRGYGNIRTSMVNEGWIFAETGDRIRIYPGVVTGEVGEITFTNAVGGYIRADTANVTLRYCDKFRNEGRIFVDAGLELRAIEGDYVQTSGITTIHGDMEVPDGIFDLQGGSLRGHGTVTGDIQVNGGVVFPGYVFDAGDLDVIGNFQILGSAFFVDLESQTNYAQLNATGDVVVAGTLYVYAIEQYIPPEGEEFVIITGATVSGEFDDVWASGVYDIAYNPDNVTLTVVTPPKTADVNDDGLVNVLDFLELLANWGPCADPCPPCYADINNDCTVDVVDFLALLANWDPFPG